MKELEIMEYLERQYALPKELEPHIRPLLIRERYTRHDVVYTPSNRLRKIWFVHSGFLCLYHFDGKLRISDVYGKGSFILFCFTDESRDSYLKVLADSVVTAIDYNRLLRLFKEGAVPAEVEKRILRDEIKRHIRQVRSLRQPAKDRLVQLLTDIPDIFLIASLDEISAYLQVSRETLRKIRNSL